MGFRFDSALGAPLPLVGARHAFALRFWPWARPPSTHAAKSGEVASVCFCESDTAYRLLQHVRRAGTPLERPILARLEHAAFLEPRILRVVHRFPSLLAEAQRATARPLSRTGGQRATPNPSTPRSRRCKLTVRSNAEVHRSSKTPLAGDAAEPVKVAPNDGLKRRQELAWVEQPGAKDLRSPRMRRRMTIWQEVPLLRDCSEHPVVIDSELNAKGLETPLVSS